MTGQTIRIADRNVGPAQPVFIIAEAGVNHNGDIGLAKQLVETAAATGADAIKFQTWCTEELVTLATPTVSYQQKSATDPTTQFEMLRRLELSQANFRELQRDAQACGILFISTPDDERSARFLAGIGVPAIKIGSGELTNLPYLSVVAQLNLPVILSTGMSTLGEVEKAVDVLRQHGLRDLVLLHATSSYPTPPEDVNLTAMKVLSQAFGVPVGYSDHTLGVEISLAAAALGAVVIEKHITLDRSLPGPDHAASLIPDEFATMVRGIRAIEKALGDGIKHPQPSECGARGLVRRKVVAAREVPAGVAIEREDLCLKRAEAGLGPDLLDMVIGRAARVRIARDEPVTWEKI